MSCSNLGALALCVSILATFGRLAVDAQSCSDVHFVFARGSIEPVGLGSVGTPLFAVLRAVLPGKNVSAYAVEYAADALQTSAGAGATDMTKHIIAYAAACPNTVFVIGGYSQGASVTDIAIGIKTILGKGQVIPTSLAPRIKAVVTFGNPLGLFRLTVASASSLYAAKSIEYCNKGDPVCRGGLNAAAHLTYPSTSVPEAATRAAALVLGEQSILPTEA
jgi:cutinase